jgi:hypothetical protein
MGKDPGHDVKGEQAAVETEIDQLRARTQQLISELERRIQDKVTGTRETVARVRHAVDVRAQLKEHPRAAAGLGAGTLIALGVGAWFLVARAREQRRLVPRVQRKALALGAMLRDPERYIARKEPVGRRVLGAVLVTAATVVIRALAQRLTEPIARPQRRLST